MRYIIRKFVEAQTVSEAIAADAKTPVHDCYLKEGEEPKESKSRIEAIGFLIPSCGEEKEP
jgi:hypothetical protein